jgi:Zn-dependent protease with chaperone function
MPSSTASSWNVLAPVIASWFLTYSLHSALLLGTAWLATSRLLQSNKLKELIWKFALIGGLVTSTAQVSGSVPAAMRWQLHPDPFSMLALEDQVPISMREEQVILQPGHSTLRTAIEHDSITPSPTDLKAQAEVPASYIWAVLVVLWLAGAAVRLARLGIEQARLAVRLGQRITIEAGPLVGMLAELSGRLGANRRIRLTCTATIASPIALGGEICIPTRALEALGPDQQYAMLAHELAHILRRDPAWLQILALLDSVFFFHPLHRLACNRLQEIAEYICDDWAARQTGQPLALAKCLAEVAGWMVTNAPHSSVAAITSGGRLAYRVQRLLGEQGDQTQQRLRGWALLPLTGLLLVGCAAPAIAVGPGEVRVSSAHVIERMGDTRLEITAIGMIHYTSDHADIRHMSSGSSFTLVEQRNRVTRSLTITPTSDGALSRSYIIQGREQPVDADARAWLASAIPRIVDLARGD